jgi:hypothetical protein
MKLSALSKASTLLLLTQVALNAHAGRPMGTDDAGTAGANKCQIENWIERDAAANANNLVVSPACGLGEAFEIGLELDRTVPDNGVRFASTLALKWVDPSWKSGPLKWGAKVWHGATNIRDLPGWTDATTGAMTLLSWKVSEAVDVHTNLGFSKDHVSGSTEPLLNLALSWSPEPSLNLMAERMAVRGTANQYNVGARWWLQTERLALDVTLGLNKNVTSGQNVSVGVGWYGID